MGSNVRKVPGGVEALQDIMDRALSIGRYSKKNPATASVRRVTRKVAWPTGRTVINVRWMSKAEVKREGWEGRGGGVAIDFNDGGILFASCDDEGNGPGVFFAISPKGEAIRVHPMK
jgi:hypothetical protein